MNYKRKSHAKRSKNGFPAKFAGTCNVCLESIQVGTLITWDYINHKRCVVHQDCKGKPPVVKEVTRPNFPPTPEQQAFFDGLLLSIQAQNTDHFVIEALAGTGKTATIEYVICDLVLKNAFPDHTGPFALYLVFNRRNMEEARQRLPLQHCDVFTTHSLGYKVVRENFHIKNGRNGNGNNKLKYLFQDNISAVEDLYEYDTNKNEKMEFRIMEKLIAKFKNHCLKPVDLEHDDDGHLLNSFCEKYDIQLPAGDSFDRTKFLHNLIWLFQLSIEDTNRVDFDDMIYFCYYFDLDLPYYPILFIDECQDLSPLRQWFVVKYKKMGTRIVVVGDRYQSIYGFTGADTESMTRLKGLLDGIEYPLTVNFRSENLYIIEEAQTIVPEIQPKPGITHGEEVTTFYDTTQFIDRMEPGDAVLSRINAPLVGIANQLLTRGIPVTILGREFCEGLIDLVQSLADTTITTVYDLENTVNTWLSHQIKNINKRKQFKIAQVEDQANSLLAICSGLDPDDPIQNVVTRLNKMFSDDANGGKRVILCSVHKSKGLQFPRVFLLRWVDGKEMFPHPRVTIPEFVQQETNLLYVGITRAEYSLTYVSYTT
jgi:DNA helicase-2/ATP-dependent DNA helicase PcrA